MPALTYFNNNHLKNNIIIIIVLLTWSKFTLPENVQCTCVIVTLKCFHVGSFPKMVRDLLIMWQAIPDNATMNRETVVLVTCPLQGND